MKYISPIIVLLLISNLDLLMGQNINQANDFETYDPIDYLKIVKRLNQPGETVKENPNYKIRYDSIQLSDQSGIRVKVLYLFDDENNSEINFYYNYQDSYFEPNAFFIFNFNQNNLLTSISFAKPWDGDTNVPGNNRINSIRRAEYNEDGKVKLFSYYLPTEDGKEFLTGQYDHIYNKRGHLSELQYYSYDNSIWSLSDLVYYYYNDDLLVEVINKIKTDTDLWLTQDSIVYKYYPDDKLKSITRFYGREVGLNDNNNIMYLYEYNHQDQLVGDHEYSNSENDVGEKRVFKFMTYHTYDTLGNLILSENYHSFGLSDSIISSEEYYTYNLDYTSEEAQLPKSNPFYYNEDILERSAFYPIQLYERYGYEQGENRGLVDREEYFYSDIMTSTQTSPEHSLTVTVQPNPTLDKIQVILGNYISECDISIVDIGGQRVRDLHDYRSGSLIDVADLDSGVYFYQVRSRDGIASGRFVKL